MDEDAKANVLFNWEDKLGYAKMFSDWLVDCPFDALKTYEYKMKFSSTTAKVTFSLN